jgi:homocitrate synthase NifV
VFRYVSVGAQDASRSDNTLLERFVISAKDAGACRVRIADTVGIWDPRRVWECFGRLRTCVGDTFHLEFHGHNDLGMATANTVAAVDGGADCVSVTVNGVGERAGNAALEEVVMALRHCLERECGLDSTGLNRVCALVARASGRPIPPAKPITGIAAFQHESGIHCHALMKDRIAYQPFAEEEVGRTRAPFVIGKHSGLASVQAALITFGVSPPKEVSSDLMARIRHRARAKKRSLTMDELHSLVADIQTPPLQTSVE